VKTKRDETMQRSTLTGWVFIGFWNASTFIDSLREAVKIFIPRPERASVLLMPLEHFVLAKNVMVCGSAQCELFHIWLTRNLFHNKFLNQKTAAKKSIL